MKIAVIAANGQAGKLITKEALNRGLDVTAIARNENKTEAKNFLQKDIFSLEKKDLEGFDAVVNAFGVFNPEELHLHSKTLKYLADLLSNTKTRLLVVGGAGSLYVDEEKTTPLCQTPDFPEEFFPLASAMAKGLAELRERNDVLWTYVSPAAEFEAEAERTGTYLKAGEVFTVNEKGKSVLSYADYAIAMIDEVIKGEHIQQRISILQK